MSKRFRNSYTSKQSLKRKIISKVNLTIKFWSIKWNLFSRAKIQTLQEQLALVKHHHVGHLLGIVFKLSNGIKTVWFDNDSGLKHLPGTQIGWGRYQDFNNNLSGSVWFPSIHNKNIHGDSDGWVLEKGWATYWANEITVLNPVKTKMRYNWSKRSFL